jgi:hypothetical protein
MKLDHRAPHLALDGLGALAMTQEKILLRKRDELAVAQARRQDMEHIEAGQRR